MPFSWLFAFNSIASLGVSPRVAAGPQTPEHGTSPAWWLNNATGIPECFLVLFGRDMNLWLCRSQNSSSRACGPISMKCVHSIRQGIVIELRTCRDLNHIGLCQVLCLASCLGSNVFVILTVLLSAESRYVLEMVFVLDSEPLLSQRGCYRLSDRSDAE